MSEIEIKRLPPDSGLVVATPEEEARRMIAYGRVMTLTRDGVRYIVLDPWERGEQP